jgi:hypothetical protein
MIKPIKPGKSKNLNIRDMSIRFEVFFMKIKSDFEYYNVVYEIKYRNMPTCLA